MNQTNDSQAKKVHIVPGDQKDRQSLQNIKEVKLIDEISIWQKVKATLHNRKYKNKQLLVGNNNRIQLANYTSLRQNVRFELLGNDNIIVIQPGAMLTNLTIQMQGSYNVLSIGANCFIGGGYLSFEDDNGLMVIGKDTSILGVHIVTSEPESCVEIGEDCLMSYDVDIRTGDSHSIIDITTGHRLNRAQSIYIGNHVWIGAHVQVLKNATIDSGSIIGTGSVVTRPIPANCSAAGVPARVLKNNVSWLREKVYSPVNPATSLGHIKADVSEIAS